MDSLFGEINKEAQDREVACVLDETVSTNSNDFTEYFPEMLVQRAVRLEDSPLLLAVLTKKPPRLVGWGWLEFYLAWQKEGRFFPLIFEAVEKSGNERARALLISALRRAFPAQSNSCQNDEAFLRQTKEWWQNHPNRQRNAGYRNSPLNSGAFFTLPEEGSSSLPASLFLETAVDHPSPASSKEYRGRCLE
jgi:hypothetical protein